MSAATILGLLIISTVVSSPVAGLNHPAPKASLKKRIPIIALPPIPPFIPIFNWEQQEYLNAHNDLRSKTGVPPLIWSANLTAAARDWAEQRRHDCNYRSHSLNHYGENIYWSSYKEFTPTDVVQWWFNEQKLYDRALMSCTCWPEREGCECGHYLNVVWSTTKRVGCSGAVYCDDQKGVLVVCDYDPAGLILGVNPFDGLKL